MYSRHRWKYDEAHARGAHTHTRGGTARLQEDEIGIDTSISWYGYRWTYRV